MEPYPVAALLGALGAVAVAVVLGLIIGRNLGRKAELKELRRAKATGEEVAARLVDEARREAETLRKSAVVTGKEEVLQLRETLEGELRKRRSEVEREEKRIADRESQLDRLRESLEGRDAEIQRRGSDIGRREGTIAKREQELERQHEEERHRLEQLAGLSAQDAKIELMRRMEDEAHADAANKLREIRESARRNADREARKIVALAVQGVAA